MWHFYGSRFPSHLPRCPLLFAIQQHNLRLYQAMQQYWTWRRFSVVLHEIDGWVLGCAMSKVILVCCVMVFMVFYCWVIALMTEGSLNKDDVTRWDYVPPLGVLPDIDFVDGLKNRPTLHDEVGTDGKNRLNRRVNLAFGKNYASRTWNENERIISSPSIVFMCIHWLW